MRCTGIHCGGCDRHGHGEQGPGGFLAVLAVLLIIVAAAIKEHGHAVAEILVIAGWSLAGLAVAGIAGLTAWRIRDARRTRASRIPAPVRAVITDVKAGQSAVEAVARQQLDHRQPPAITGQARPDVRVPQPPAGHRDGQLWNLDRAAWDFLEGHSDQAPRDGDQS
jgi:hypothetical protein